MKILLLTRAHILKNRPASWIFSLLIAVTAVLLQTSFVLDRSFHELFERVSLETNSAGFAEIIPQEYYESRREKIDAFLQGKTGSERIEIEEGISLLDRPLLAGGQELFGSWIIRNADRKSMQSLLRIVEESGSAQEHPIYLPVICRDFFGLALGDEVSLKLGEEELVYQVAGFTEDILFGSRALMAFDMRENEFRQLREKIREEEKSLIFLASGENQSFPRDFRKAGGKFPYEFATGREQARYSRESSLRIYRLILLCFAGLNGAVVLLTVVFRLKNTLKKEKGNIGVLKALGYRSREIMLSYVLQFLLLSAVGIAFGIACSGTFFHRFLAPVTAEAGFLWRNLFPWRDTAVWMSLFLLLIAAAAGSASGRMRRVSAVEALSRRDESAQNRKHFLPLGSSILPLDVSMAGKIFWNARRQNGMLILICAFSVMAGAFALTLFRNIVADREGLLQIAGVEDFSIVLRPGEGEEIDRLAQEIEALGGVRRAIKAVGPGGDVLICEGEIEARTTVYSDYEGLRKGNLCEGRYPLHDNETAISTMLAERTGKKPGDRIRIESVWGGEENKEGYLITGLTQGSYSGGMDVFLTMEGLRSIEPESGWGSLYLHLEPGRDTGEVIAEILQSKAWFISYIEDFQKLFEQQFSAAVFNILLLVFFILILTALVILMVIVLMSRSLLLDHRFDVAILRAMGFTNARLMKQIALSSLPVIVSGGALGYALSLCFTNALLEKMFRGMGVYQLSLRLPLGWIALLVLSLCLMSYATSLLTAFRTGKYSPVELIRQRDL